MGRFWTKDTKRPKKPNCHFRRARSKTWVSGAKAGYCARPLHATPPKGWAKHLSHPSGPTPGRTPALTRYKEQARASPPQRASKGSCYWFWLPAAANKALAEFLVWPLVRFCWGRGKGQEPWSVSPSGLRLSSGHGGSKAALAKLRSSLPPRPPSPVGRGPGTWRLYPSAGGSRPVRRLAGLSPRQISPTPKSHA